MSKSLQPGTVWLALLALLGLSLGSAYLDLGVFNLVAGLVIAALKIGLIAVFFMRLGRASGWSRLSVATALVALAVLGTLSAFEAGTRASPASAYQRPDTLPPLRAQASACAGRATGPRPTGDCVPEAQHAASGHADGSRQQAARHSFSNNGAR